ncbi:hypothetical protein M6B38_146835 [Iris pallida]|uniref:Uncharacterized protein n=1 Tax=Iris pallida TaxID=29817 RepID=A0AAX6FA91_IRIPA|nr:hypothetical protein M6B38_146835 [Iris pallida]
MVIDLFTSDSSLIFSHFAVFFPFFFLLIFVVVISHFYLFFS